MEQKQAGEQKTGDVWCMHIQIYDAFKNIHHKSPQTHDPVSLALSQMYFQGQFRSENTHKNPINYITHQAASLLQHQNDGQWRFGLFDVCVCTWMLRMKKLLIKNFWCACTRVNTDMSANPSLKKLLEKRQKIDWCDRVWQTDVFFTFTVHFLFFSLCTINYC